MDAVARRVEIICRLWEAKKQVELRKLSERPAPKPTVHNKGPQHKPK